jgi:hypothetical protein
VRSVDLDTHTLDAFMRDHLNLGGLRLCIPRALVCM